MRLPKTTIDTTKNHMPPKEIEARERNTPTYDGKEFKAPDSLTKDELKIWDWLVAKIRATKNSKLCDLDIHTMELYCQAKAQYDRACKAWEADPRYNVVVVLGTDKDGKPRTTSRVNPNYLIKKDFMSIFPRYLRMLDLCPTGRVSKGILGGKEEQEDLFEKLNRRSDD